MSLLYNIILEDFDLNQLTRLAGEVNSPAPSQDDNNNPQQSAPQQNTNPKFELLKQYFIKWEHIKNIELITKSLEKFINYFSTKLDDDTVYQLTSLYKILKTLEPYFPQFTNDEIQIIYNDLINIIASIMGDNKDESNI